MLMFCFTQGNQHALPKIQSSVGATHSTANATWYTHPWGSTNAKPQRSGNAFDSMLNGKLAKPCTRKQFVLRSHCLSCYFDHEIDPSHEDLM